MNPSFFAPSPLLQSPVEAYNWCLNLASSHYENFPVASRLLPRRIRPHIAAVYAFARIADDIADEPGLEQTERLHLLDDWERQLDICTDRVSEHPVFVALGQTIVEHRLPKQLLADLLSAFRQDVTTQRYETFGDLLDYCRRSANPVGRIVLRLFGHIDMDLDRESDAVCTALQLTNFWQDLGIDISRGRLYLPREDLRRYHCREDLLLKGEPQEPFYKLMAFEVDRTRALFRRGVLLPEAVRQPLRLELRLTWLGGMRILDKIERSEYTILKKRPKLSWKDVPGMLLRSTRRLI